MQLPEPAALDEGALTAKALHLDVLGGGSEEDLHLNLKYYADEEERRDWAKDWPEEPMPAHEDLPYDRDRHLPQPD